MADTPDLGLVLSEFHLKTTGFKENNKSQAGIEHKRNSGWHC